MKRRALLLLSVFICIIVVFEIYLRGYWGFCDAVLMRVDDSYEYIAQSDQDRFRFRKHIRYNEYSMRSKPVNTSDSVRILGFGDSVINGGTQTDNEDLATTLIEDSLTRKYNVPIRCLNISAGSWGPDNCYAYLEKHGNFDADIILLVVSSHDAHDNMDFHPIVGSHVGFPSRQYPLAITELTDRYLIPRVDKLFLMKSKNTGDPISKGSVFNSGFGNFQKYSIEHNIPLIIYLHPEISEVKQGVYNSQGQEIIDFCEKNNINLIKELDHGIDPSMFRDQIHINEKGQKFMSSILIQEIEKHI